jgi:hypothetical protein
MIVMDCRNMRESLIVFGVGGLIAVGLGAAAWLVWVIGGLCSIMPCG